jgi:hypothetical protein
MKVPYRFEYNLLLPYSCDGEPEFSRGMPLGIPARELPELIGYFIEPLDGGSIGEVAAVDEPERGWLVPSWGM